MKLNRILAGGMLALIVVAGLPGAGHAAWWPWSRKSNPPAAAAPPGTDTQAGTDQLTQVEAAVRDLTGQVEQLTFQLRQLEAEVADSEARLEQLEGASGVPRKQALTPMPAAPAIAPAPLAEPAPAAAAAPPPAAPPAADVAAVPVAPQGPVRVVGDAPVVGPDQVVAPAAGDQPIDLTANARAVAPAKTPAETAAAPKPDVLASLGDPRGDYDAAYNNILAGDYDRAYETAAEDAERLLVRAGRELAPRLLDFYPAAVWEDQDECLEVRPEDVPV